jgi:hypothetical protein
MWRTVMEVNGDAAVVLLGALVRGNATQAQFDHPDLGGMGQWSQSGLVMVGDMFIKASSIAWVPSAASSPGFCTSTLCLTQLPSE